MKYYFKFLISKQSSSKNLHQTRSHHMKRFAIQITAAAESIEKPTPKTFVLLFHHHHLLPYFLICVCCRSLSFGMQRNACRCVIYHLLNFMGVDSFLVWDLECIGRRMALAKEEEVITFRVNKIKNYFSLYTINFEVV